MKRAVRLTDWIGRAVEDPDGSVVGVIEDVRAQTRGSECVVSELRLAPQSMLERLGVRPSAEIRVPIDAIDLSDPEHPRLRVPVTRLL